MSDVEIIDKATQLIMKWEGFSAKPYQCQAGKWTIGYGRTGINVHEKTAPTTKVAELGWLKNRIKQDLDWLRLDLPDVVLNDGQWAALLSLVYNIGQGAFKVSKLRKHIMARETLLIQNTWLLFINANGKPNKGLKNRRIDELFLWNEQLDF